MRKQTDHQWEIERLAELRKLKVKPRLLMQSCCAVCNSWPLEYLFTIFDITIYFNNSNIYPEAEFQLRLHALQAYVDAFNKAKHTSIDIIAEPYAYLQYDADFLSKRNQDKEGAQRCGMCYALRINQALAYANKHAYAYCTTVMTISRQKHADKINGIARRLAQAYPNTNYFYSNFKKNQGIDFSVKIAKSLGIYKQEYCGCAYSMHQKDFDV